MPSGIQGLAQGIMAGVEPGMVIGDRIAALRANNRMQDIQDKLSNGAYTNDPAGQQQLQDDIRQAQAPLSARGLDNTYGGAQQSRIMGLQSLRGDQQAAALVQPSSDGSAPNYAPALAAQAGTQRTLGNLPGAMQADQMAGQITAGRNAVNTSGQTDLQGTLPGGVNQTALATGTSANAANFGDNSSAQQWGTQAQQQGSSAVQGMLGRAITVATNPQLGGIQAAAPYVHSAAQMMGYGDVSYSPSQNALSVLDAQGKQVALITPQNITQFAQTVGNDPTQILSNIRGLQAQEYQDQRTAAQTNRTGAQNAAYDIAKQTPSDAMLNQAERAATQSQTLAEKTGWKVLHAADETDASGAPTGTKKIIVQPPGSVPLLMTINPPDPSNPTQPAFRLQRQDGSDIPAAQMGGLAQQAQALAQAASDQAVLNNMKLNRDRFNAGMAHVQDVYHQFDPNGGQGVGAPGAMQGQPPASNNPNAPRGVQNNNPGNLQKSNADWEGKVSNGTDSRFEQFSTPQAGIQAMAQNALSLQDTKGAQTITDLIGRWAPAKENGINSTLAYVYDVAHKMGVDPDQPVDLHNPQTLAAFTNAVIAHENNGHAYAPELVNQAVLGAVGKATQSYNSTIASRNAARNTKSGIMSATVPAIPRPQIHVEGALSNGPANKYLYRG